MALLHQKEGKEGCPYVEKKAEEGIVLLRKCKVPKRERDDVSSGERKGKKNPFVHREKEGAPLLRN